MTVTLHRIVSLLFAALVMTTGVAAHSQQRLVRPLQDQSVVLGCAWSASSEDIGPGLILVAEYDESLIVMNIDGTDVRLDLDPSSGAGFPSRIGDRVTKVYTADSLRVEAVYTTTWVCPPNQESCEVTRFDVTFVVKQGNQTETVKATGDVGC
jgi:hypothetical protein